MPRSRSTARWWRVSLHYRGQLVYDASFAASERVTVGEGGTSIVLPGVETAALVEGDAVCRVAGLELREIEADGTHVIEVAAAPDVVMRARYETCERPNFASGLRGPWRELAYGVAAAGCVAGLLLAHQIAIASPSGGPAAMSGRMERAIFVEVDRSMPMVATFAAPVQAREVEEDTTQRAVPPAADELPLREPVAKAKRKRVRSQRKSTAGTHSHRAEGQPEPGGGIGNAVAAAETCDDPQSEPKDNVDVVFVIDVSTTMAFALDSLADEIVALDAAVRAHDPERRYGLVLFVDDVLVVDGNPYTDIDTLRRDFRRWSGFTSSNRQIRSDDQNLDWPENGLDALTAAATEFDWRDADDTLRLVVYASDDDFGEKGAVQSGQRVRNDYAHTVDALQAASIRVASFTAPIGGRCECDDVRGGFMTDYREMPSIPIATGGASFDIDEVASGRLHFDRVVSGLVDNLVCDE